MSRLQGLIALQPRENSPEFIKARLIIYVDELIEVLENRRGEKISIDIMQGKKDGKYHAKENTYKADKQIES